MNQTKMLNYFKILILSLLIVCTSLASAEALPAQKHQHFQEEGKGKGEGDVPENTLKSSETAREIIHSIVHSVGLKPNFEIRQAKISNAAAVNYKGKRFILYDAKFIERIQKATQTDWAAVSILAHEIGHHLNGHTILGKEGRDAALELEADEFSGFIMRQMGASLEEALTAMKLISSEKGSASHPPKKLRLAAIERGYIDANERILAYTSQPVTQIAATYQLEEEELKQLMAFSFADDNLFKEVHFNKIPQHTFYLTKDLKLVAMTDKGRAVLGNLEKINDRLVLNLRSKKGSSKLYVSTKGRLLDENNKVVGYIKNKA